MKRRSCLNHLGIGTSAIAVTQLHSAIAQSTNNHSVESDTIEWRLASHWPRTLDIPHKTIEQFCQRVRRMTDDKFKIIPSDTSANISIPTIRQVVSDNTFECGHTTSIEDFDTHTALAFGAFIPFGLTAQQQDSWLYYGGGLDAINNIYKDLGVISFPIGHTGSQLGGWFREKLTRQSTLQGLKIHSSGLAISILERLGVDVIPLESSQLSEALRQGKLDAAQYMGLHEEQQLGLADAAQVCHYPGWSKSNETQLLLINLEQWNRLPNAYQEVIQSAVIETKLDTLTKHNYANSQTLKQLTAKGVEFAPYPSEILEALYQNSFDYYEELATQDVTFGQIYISWKSFKDQIYAWTLTNEHSFTTFVVNAV